MAIGDDATAAGIETVPSSALVKDAYLRINQKGDEIAREKTARVAADVLKFDAAKIKIQTGTPAVVSGGIWFKPV